MGGTRTAAAPLDVLRRRLYAPDATEEDLAAYRAAEAAAVIEPGPAPVRRRLPRRPVAVIACVVAVTAVGALVVLRPLAGVPVATGPSPTALAATTTPGDGVLPAPQAVRAAFVSGLEARSGAGLLEYLYGHPTFLPEALQAPTRGHVLEDSGSGAARVDLSPNDLDGDAGRLTVVVVPDRTTRLSWRPVPAAGSGRAGPWRHIEARAGVPVSTTIRYAHGAPSTLEVDSPDGTSWGVLVALTN